MTPNITLTFQHKTLPWEGFGQIGVARKVNRQFDADIGKHHLQVVYESQNPEALVE